MALLLYAPPTIAGASALLQTRVYLAEENAWLAVFLLEDQPRHQSADVVAGLRASGLRVHLLSGDQREPVAALARSLQIAHFAAQAPPEDKARVSPLMATEKDIAKGQALFRRHCSSCHGSGGKGDGPAAGFGAEVPDDLTDPARQDRLTDGEIFWKVSNGRREGAEIVMPSFSREISSEADRWRVVAFLRTLRREP